MVGDLRVLEVRGRRMLREFVRLPWVLHRGHANWVPPLLIDEWRTFDLDRNPAARHCDATLAIAVRGGEPAGRIVGIVHRRHNTITGERTARFGWLESVPDPTVARALLHHVERWAAERRMRRVVGPMGFTDQDPEGYLVEGFAHEPTIATYYNHPYMNDLLAGAGYEKEIDYVVYRLDAATPVSPRHRRLCARLQRAGNFRLLEFEHRRSLRPHIRPILDLMSATFTEAYGFVPPDPAEIRALVRTYQHVIDPRFVKAVQRGGELVGFIIGMPNIAPGLRRANGHLFPLGAVRIWRAMRTSRQLDLLMGGIRADCRGRGVDVLLGAAMLDTARRLGFVAMDSHHEMETNHRMRAEMEKRGAEAYKRFRIYQKPIAHAPGAG